MIRRSRGLIIIFITSRDIDVAFEKGLCDSSPFFILTISILDNIIKTGGIDTRYCISKREGKWAAVSEFMVKKR